MNIPARLFFHNFFIQFFFNGQVILLHAVPEFSPAISSMNPPLRTLDWMFIITSKSHINPDSFFHRADRSGYWSDRSSFGDESTDKFPFEPELVHELINTALVVRCPRGRNYPVWFEMRFRKLTSWQNKLGPGRWRRANWWGRIGPPGSILTKIDQLPWNVCGSVACLTLLQSLTRETINFITGKTVYFREVRK
jgi:hypothetical protein